MSVMAFFVPFVLYFVVLFALSFIVVEFGQSYFYDEPIPSAATKVAIGSAILALIITILRTDRVYGFMGLIGVGVLIAILAFAVFTLVYRFQPWHALPIGVITVLLAYGLGVMVIQSFSDRNRPLPREGQSPAKPLRRSTPVSTQPALPEAKSKK